MNVLKTGMIATAAVLLAACGSDDAAPTGPSGDGSVTASVNGVLFNTSTAASGSLQGQVLSIDAWQTLTEGEVRQRWFQIEVNGVTGAGSFTFGGVNPHSAYYHEIVSLTDHGIWAAATVGGDGTVNLTTLTATRAAGTFTFSMLPMAYTDATGTKTVTNGTFDVALGG